MFDFIQSGRYWDKPWSLVSGCTRCSPGCDRCWALAMERRFGKRVSVITQCGQEYGRAATNGQVEIHPERLGIPLRRKKPTVWAIWNDLHHEYVPLSFISTAYDYMADSPQHIFLVLTKRADRLAHHWTMPAHSDRTVPPNVWIGVTVCNQDEADTKIPLLLQIPAAVRWVSVEPMLGPIVLNKTSKINGIYHDWLTTTGIIYPKGLDWVVLGGETGPGARPLHPDWAISVRDQCQEAGVPFYFKGWGEWITKYKSSPNDELFPHFRQVHCWNPKYCGLGRRDWAYRVGKKAAGRMLDGRTWDQIPEVGR